MSFDLSAVPTCELVDEFKKREGVWATSVEPYEKYSITVGEEIFKDSGPVVMLRIWDWIEKEFYYGRIKRIKAGKRFSLK